MRDARLRLRMFSCGGALTVQPFSSLKMGVAKGFKPKSGTAVLDQAGTVTVGGKKLSVSTRSLNCVSAPVVQAETVAIPRSTATRRSPIDRIAVRVATFWAAKMF